ncbi:hypothetical protein EMCRGX_G031233 [Ephydatia muelleri]
MYLNADLEAKMSTCEACQANRKSPPKAPLHPWKWPSKPWSRLHVDFAGPFQGKTLFVLVDAHSKWLEASVVASTSSEQAIKALRRVFATHGFPEVLVSDNGTAFTSTEFQTFVKRNGFRHVKTAPYHPASNGLAERAVQTVKEALKKSSGDMEACLIRFLFQYRLTPHSTTGRSLAELLLGRQPRSHLDFMVPERQDKECNNTYLESHVRKNQERQKTGHDQHAQYHSFNVGDTVYVLNHRGSPKWISAVVAKCSGPLSLVVKFPDGLIVAAGSEAVSDEGVIVAAGSETVSDKGVIVAAGSEAVSVVAAGTEAVSDEGVIVAAGSEAVSDEGVIVAAGSEAVSDEGVIVAAGSEAVSDEGVIVAAGSEAVSDEGVIVAAGSEAVSDEGVVVAAGMIVAAGSEAVSDEGVIVAAGSEAVSDEGVIVAAGSEAVSDEGVIVAAGSEAVSDEGVIVAAGSEAEGVIVAAGSEAVSDEGVIVAAGSEAEKGECLMRE